MIKENNAKKYCSEDISLIENYQEAISDQNRMWDIHHRRECDENGRTLFTYKQLIEMNLYENRPASELIFVTRSMHWKLHREKQHKWHSNGGKIACEKLTFEQRSKGGKSQLRIEKRSIPILQFSKSGEFIKEWPSVNEAGRQLGIQNICSCLKGRYKSAGGYIWKYKEA